MASPGLSEMVTTTKRNRSMKSTAKDGGAGHLKGTKLHGVNTNHSDVGVNTYNSVTRRGTIGKTDTLAGHTAKATPLRMSGKAGAHRVGASCSYGSGKGHQVGRKK